MLNPPLSLLSDDLLMYIVDHIAKPPFSKYDLYNLSITDRAFTQFCQAYIFKDLRLNDSIPNLKLEKIRNILNDKPSLANRVRTVHLVVTPTRNKFPFNDPNFITIIELLAKSPMPPHELHFTGWWASFIMEDSVVGWLMQSFFSQTLTVLNLDHCENVPLTLFLVCPNLRELYLDVVEGFDPIDSEYHDTQCSGRELPALEYLHYQNSGSLVKQMIKFPMAAVVWSKLRILKLCPQEKEGMVCLQPILDAACNTLEELYLINEPWNYNATEQLSLAGRVDLIHLSNLLIFAIHSIKCDAQEPVVLRDIKLVLSTIPKANQVTKLSLGFIIDSQHPFSERFEEDLVGMCDEVVRVSAGKPLELDLKMSDLQSIFQPEYPPLRQDQFYERIKEKMAFLSDYPNICTDFWYPLSEVSTPISMSRPPSWSPEIN